MKVMLAETSAVATTAAPIQPGPRGVADPAPALPASAPEAELFLIHRISGMADAGPQQCGEINTNRAEMLPD
ncbi:hypothetical protein [Methylobacterium haplocladii]|uniref:Uncharacterized protein n=1 Tax=Methylobacterium haplocladii TaxID=1176176 RepID=A0A512ITD9_9HYPH|nr:hypothetical protein [Methylobacterium haplocladii]GEP00961.1 hypothetical protein MHA02_33480 [Methylobacterium haplocladii]GLS58307.1 hypothetical protein GCM10007887_09660 [Methylobacterium haplocladii]